MPDVRTALSDLVEKLSADGDLSDEDLALIHDAAVAQATAVQEAKRWAELAHVHDEPHRPVVTLDGDALLAYLAAPDFTEGPDGALGMVPPDQRVPEHVDASGVICHDCGRDLVADAGTTRVLVCPSLHGRRPGDMVPTDPDGALECGRARP